MLGGLITIDCWGWKNISCAMCEIMLSDLPHIQYHPKDLTDEQIQMYKEVIADDNRKIKKHGIANALGIAFNTSKTVDIKDFNLKD